MLGRPAALSHPWLRSAGGRRAIRGLAAALVTVAALITAANAIPADATQETIPAVSPTPRDSETLATLPSTRP